MDALDRLQRRTAGLIAAVEAGQPVDLVAVDRVMALEVVQAGVEFVQDSLARQDGGDGGSQPQRTGQADPIRGVSTDGPVAG